MGKRKFKEGDVVEFRCSERYRRTCETYEAPPNGAKGTVNYYAGWGDVFIDWVDAKTEKICGDYAWPPVLLSHVRPNYTPVDYYQAITGE